MQKIITLPQIELNLENVTVVELSAKVGASLTTESILLILETQKATVEVPCGDTGYLRAFLVKNGDLVSVHDKLAVLTDTPDEPFQLPERSGVAATPEVSVKSEAPPLTEASADGEKIRAMPAARKRAKELGVDLSSVKGSGPQGRISVEDVEAHLNTAPSLEGGTPLSANRKALIAQMETGHREIPQIALSRLMDVTNIAARTEGTTFTSRLVYHLARAVEKHPILLTALEDEQLKPGPVDIAVAMDTSSGLVAPVIRNAHGRNLQEITHALTDLRQRGEENRLGRDDMKNGRFALTNLGMLGIDLFTPLVFSGQTAVLAIGKTVTNNNRSYSWFTLAVDHRIVDGADAARFLETLQETIGGNKS